MCHLKTRPSEPALHVEPFVGFAAVEDALVAADLLCDVIERLDDPQAQFLPLLVLGYSNVFDVSDLTEIVDAKNTGGEQLLATAAKRPWIQSSGQDKRRSGERNLQLVLDDQSTCANDHIPSCVLDDENVV